MDDIAVAHNPASVKEFCDLVAQNVAVPVAAMNCLVSVIRRSKSGTWMQLERELSAEIKGLKSHASTDVLSRSSCYTVNSVVSGCELFMKYVTRSFSELDDFDCTKAELLSRAETYAGMSLSSRQKISEIGHSFVQDGCTVLVHGNSRVVSTLLLNAAAQSKKFRVVVTDGRPDADG